MPGSELPPPRLTIEPYTGRPVLLAPQRRHRPRTIGTAGPRCPFCPGHEADTPPELDAVRDGASAPDRPGWRVRLFPNLYPASDLHWVGAEGAEHDERPARLPLATWLDSLALYQRSAARIESHGRIAFWFKNVGAAAGASIAHNHSQILGLSVLPPRLELALSRQTAHGGCAVCDELASAERERRLIHVEPGVAAFAPRHPKLPHETWIAPWRHDHDWRSGDDAEQLARTLATLCAALDRALGEVPFNLWLHRVPAAPLHWHYELQPRTGNLAGLELGADMYINSVPGDESAALLRGG
jgi:UDPglucose--hexose-1-phosphate uridylyltransferase